MAKIILSFAIAFLAVMTAFASAAQAGPKVRLGIGVAVPLFSAQKPSKSYGAKRYKKKRVYRSTKKRKARPAKKRIVKRKTTAKKVETAKSAPIESETDNQNSSISTASLDNDETATNKSETDNQNSSISTASLDNDETVAENTVETEAEPKVARNVGCKKFFPTVGMTLTVSCE